MPRGVHDRFLQDVTDVVSEGPGRGVGELEARLDPDVPHTLEPLHQLMQADVQARLFHRAAGGELRVADQEAEVALLVGDEALDLPEPLTGGPRLGLQDALGGFELQGRAGQRL